MTAARTITTRYGGIDGGELAATALSGGVAHPTGYPTYLLLARAALLLPLGEAATRLALLSAWCGALAVACTTAVVALITSTGDTASSGSISVLAGMYAGLSLAFSTRAWSQAIIVEVYAQHLLWLTLCALLGLTWLSSSRRLALPIAALCLGLGLGNHLTLAIVVPAAILAWVVTPRRPPVSVGLLSVTIAALITGLAIYGFLPMWAARQAVPSWGDQRTLSGFLTHVSGAEYRYLVGIVPWNQQFSRLGFAVRDLLVQPGPVGLMLAVGWGLPHGWRTQRPLTAFSGCVALFSLLFAISYGGADGMVYLLPWTWAWCVWAGLGVQAVGTMLVGQTTRRRLIPLFIALLAVSLLWPVSMRYHRLDLHADTSERDQVIERLTGLPSDALMLTNDDTATFGAWYAQRALGVRPDVVVIDTRLLARPWYRKQVGRVLKMTGDHAVCQALRQSKRPVYSVSSEGRLVQASRGNWVSSIECSD